jgi:proliferating cell nuclear antigen
VVEAIKDLIEDANFDCNSTGFSLQAMDSSHVSLVALSLRSDGFEHYRCDRNVSMGELAPPPQSATTTSAERRCSRSARTFRPSRSPALPPSHPPTPGMKLANLSKILKCAANDDAITMKSEDNGDAITFVFESEKQERLSEFDLKLMDIDSEHLGIPDNDYDATVKLPAGEFQRIVKDLATIGDTVEIAVTKDAVQFSTHGDIGSATVMCRHNAAAEKDDATEIEVTEPVALTFALRYLNSFAKATPLATHTVLKLSRELPVVVEYAIPDVGHLRFYLAPKIEDEEMDA